MATISEVSGRVFRPTRWYVFSWFLMVLVVSAHAFTGWMAFGVVAGVAVGLWGVVALLFRHVLFGEIVWIVFEDEIPVVRRNPYVAPSRSNTPRIVVWTACLFSLPAVEIYNSDCTKWRWRVRHLRPDRSAVLVDARRNMTTTVYGGLHGVTELVRRETFTNEMT